jgi:TolB-like protein
MKKIITLFSLTFITTTNAQTIFQKTFGGTNADWGNAALVLTDGRFMIAGSTSSVGAGNYDFYLIQLDANGDTLCTKTYGGAQNDICTALRQTSDGGYVMVGNSETVTAGGTDVCLVRTDSSGNLLWAKNYGGAEADEGFGVQQTTDGGFIVCGNTLSISSDLTSDIFLIKTDALGDTMWTREFTGIFDDFGYSVVQADDGGYLVTGTTNSFGPGVYDFCAVKTNANGLYQWSRTYGHFGLEYSYTMIKVTSGGYAIAGHTSSFGAGDVDVCLLRIDNGGNMLWAKTYGRDDSDVPNFLSETADGGFAIAGYTQDVSAGNTNFFVGRTDSSGNMLWSKSYGGSNNDEAYSVRETADGGYLMVGHSYSFGAGSVDLYIVKTDSIGNSGCNQTTPATVAGTAGLQTLGFPVNIQFGASVFSPTFTTGGGSTFTNPCIPTGNDDIENEHYSSSIFPNPASEEFTIYNLRFTISKIEIYNMIGKKVLEHQTSDIEHRTVSIADFTPGIYFVRVYGDDNTAVFKLIKE